jgi:3-hydroxyisobutyrate dehydrogenase
VPTISWIGLGHMGGPMAANLVRAGFTVRGFDLSADAVADAVARGVDVAASVRDTVADADVVFTMLPSGDHVRRVLTAPNGVLESTRPGTLIVDSSTIDIIQARELHESVSSSDRRFLDAPVSGGVFGAQAGTLTFMIGGAAADLDDARPAIEVMAGRIFHAGGPGSGQAAKICNNMMLLINTASLCEGAVLAQRLGLDARTFHEIAQVSSGDSWPLRAWYPVPGVVDTAAVNREFAGGFATDLALKDGRLALAAGAATGTDLPFATMIVDRLRQLSERGLGGLDCTAVVGLVDGSLDSVPATTS